MAGADNILCSLCLPSTGRPSRLRTSSPSMAAMLSSGTAPVPALRFASAGADAPVAACSLNISTSCLAPPFQHERVLRIAKHAAAHGEGPCAAHARWDGNYITFLDGLLQASVMKGLSTATVLRIPTRIRHLTINVPGPTFPLGSEGDAPGLGHTAAALYAQHALSGLLHAPLDSCVLADASVTDGMPAASMFLFLTEEATCRRTCRDREQGMLSRWRVCVAVLVRIDQEVATASCDLCEMRGLDISAAPRKPLGFRRRARMHAGYSGEALPSECSRGSRHSQHTGWTRLPPGMHGGPFGGQRWGA